MVASVLVAANGVDRQDTNPIAFIAGSDRYAVIAVQSENTWTPTPTCTISGVTDTVLTLIGSAVAGTMDVAFYGVNDAGIGDTPSTANGSLTYDGTAPAGSNVVVSGILAQDVDQTTSFTNTSGVGYDTDSTNSTENCTFVLDEIIGGLGVAFLSCSKTGTTWDLTDNGYAKNGSGQWTQATNTSANCAVKSITSQVLGASTTLTTGLTGDKTGTLAIILLPVATSDVTISPNLETLSITTFNPFVLASNIATLTQSIDNYQDPVTVSIFGHALSNTSGATYRDDTDEVYVIRNGAKTIHVYNRGNYSTVIKTITLAISISDTEGICDMGGGEFAVSSEDAGAYYVDIFDYPAGTSATSKQQLTIAPAGTDNNSGAEDIAFDRKNRVFYVIGEGQQASTDRKFFRFERPANQTTDYDYNDPELTVTEPFNAETAFASLGATGADWDLAGLDFDHASENCVVASHTGGELAQFDVEDGTIYFTKLVPELFQMEGVAILPDGDLMVLGEPDEYQIFEAITVMTPNTESLAISFLAPLVTHDVSTTITPNLETLSISMLAPSVDIVYSITPNVETLSIATFNPSLNISNSITPNAESLLINVFNPVVTIGTELNITPNVEALSITTFNPSISTTSDHLITPQTLSLEITTFNVSLFTGVVFGTNGVSTQIKQTVGASATIKQTAGASATIKDTIGITTTL